MLKLSVKTLATSLFNTSPRTMCTHTLKHITPIPVFGIEGRYVAALYSAGHQTKKLEDIEKSLRGMQSALTNPTVRDFIEASTVSRIEKAKILETFGKDASLPSEVINFLSIVAENGRLKLLRKMITLYLAVMVAHRKEALCEVITAEPLDESTRSKLLAVLKTLAKGKNIQLTEKVDSSVIGGMVVGVEDKHIDLSIARKILMYTEILTQSI